MDTIHLLDREYAPRLAADYDEDEGELLEGGEEDMSEEDSDEDDTDTDEEDGA